MTFQDTTPIRDDVRLECRDQVAYVTIDRPKVLNALDASATARLEQIWTRIEADPDLRCVVLTGGGERAFCTGADMSVEGVGKSGLDYWASLEPDGFGAISLRQTLEIPVIARVNGYALGGGMEMVLGCDIVIAADTAQFALPEPRVGRLPLDGGMVLLQRKIPYNAAMGMMLTGRRVPAAELQKWGLVNEVVPGDELRDRAWECAAALAKGATRGLGLIRHLLRETWTSSLSEQLAAETAGLVDSGRTADTAAAIEAFLSKQPAPRFQGR